MAVYFPKFEDIYVYRNSRSPESYITLVVRDHEQLSVDPPSVVIDGIPYVYDEHGTDHTRMFMRVREEQRESSGA